jgi:hypothetical protein
MLQNTKSQVSKENESLHPKQDYQKPKDTRSSVSGAGHLTKSNSHTVMSPQPAVLNTREDTGRAPQQEASCVGNPMKGRC